MSKRTWRYKIRQIQIAGEIAYIRLSRGRVAVIDAADVCRVEGWNWSAVPGGNTWYAARNGNRRIKLHQLLMPSPPGMVTDHIDRNGLNCRRSNLRLATALQNSHNREQRGVSGFKGVASHGARWRARITVNGQRLHLGAWDNPTDAALAYDAAAARYFGEYAYLNFPTQLGNEIAKTHRTTRRGEA